MRALWTPSSTIAATIAIVTMSLTLVACDDAKGGDRKDLEAAAAAALGAEKDAEAKAREEKEAAERRKSFDERKTKEAAVEGQLQALEIGLVALPTKLPKDLESACTQLIEVYPDWIRAVYFDDDGTQLAFFDAKSKNLGEVKGNCAKVGSVEAAACMIEVIKLVSAEGFPEADRKAIQGKPDHFFDACATKYPRK